MNFFVYFPPALKAMLITSYVGVRLRESTTFTLE